MGGSVRDCLWSIIIIIITCVGESVSSLAKNRKEKIIVSRSGEEEMKEQKGMKLWTIVVSYTTIIIIIVCVSLNRGI